MWQMFNQCSLLYYSHPTPQKGGQISGWLRPGWGPQCRRSGLPSHAPQHWPRPLCPGLPQSGQGLEDGRQVGQARALQPRTVPYTALETSFSATRRWKYVCCQIALRFKASLLQPETNAGVAVPYIQNETKEKKTKRTPAPKPRKACGPFPRQNVQPERKERLCGCCPDTEPQSAAALGAQVRGSEPQRPQSPTGGAGGLVLRGSKPFGQPGPGPGRRALRPAPGSTRSPCRNPGNVAGRGSIWPAAGQREGSNLEFLGCFRTKFPQEFQPREVEAHRGEKKLPTSPLWAAFVVAPDSRSESTQKPLPRLERSLLCV